MLRKTEKISKLPKISIVVPVLNNEKFIGETLQSIVDQNYTNLEVVIQDGMSTDGTLKIAREYQNRYPKIFNIHSETDKGHFDAINKGIKTTSGEIVSFLNSDDLYVKGALNAVKNSYVTNPEAFWFAGFGAVINDKGNEISKPITYYKNLLINVNRYNLLIMVNYLMQPSVFLTRSTYDKFGPFLGTNKYLREYDFWMKLGRIQMPIVIPKTLSYFRLSKNMISAKKFKEIAEDDLDTAKKYSDNQFLLFLRSLHNKARGLFIP